jgi:hypothetical protein
MRAADERFDRVDERFDRVDERFERVTDGAERRPRAPDRGAPGRRRDSGSLRSR